MVVERMVTKRNERRQLINDKSRYIACTAHDLLTPLTGMQLSLSLAKKSKKQDEIRELVNTSLHCVEMMGMIVNRSMTLFQSSDDPSPGKRSHSDTPESPELPPSEQLTVISLQSLFAKIQKVIDAYPKSVSSLRIIVDPLCPPRVYMKGTGEVSVYQSALNYLTNACKATKSGHIEMHVTASPTTKMLSVECHDTGMGVAPENYSQLFVPFSEINKSTLNGSGLGLYSVAYHIRNLGGKYGHRPKIVDGKTVGSIFWFSIPVIFGETDGEGAGLVATGAFAKNEKNSSAGTLSSHGSNSSGGRIKKLRNDNDLKEDTSNAVYARSKCALVIDDSITVRKPLAKAISRIGFQVDTAVNGLEGLNMMKANMYDLVLCDFLMPIMDGIDTVVQLRQWEAAKRPNFRQLVIGISANAGISEDEPTDQASAGDKFKQYGFDGFKAKPIALSYVTELCCSERVEACGRAIDATGGPGNSFGGYPVPVRQVNSSILSSLSSLEDVQATGDLGGGRGRTCLIAEDSLSVRKMLRKAVEKAGYEVDEAPDGITLLSMLQIKPSYDKVLVDNNMGGDITGTEAIIAFREWENKTSQSLKGKHGKIVSITSASEQNKLQADSQARTIYDDYLPKPIDIGDLYKMLGVDEKDLAPSGETMDTT